MDWPKTVVICPHNKLTAWRNVDDLKKCGLLENGNCLGNHNVDRKCEYKEYEVTGELADNPPTKIESRFEKKVDAPF